MHTLHCFVRKLLTISLAEQTQTEIFHLSWILLQLKSVVYLPLVSRHRFTHLNSGFLPHEGSVKSSEADFLLLLVLSYLHSSLIEV